MLPIIATFLTGALLLGLVISGLVILNYVPPSSTFEALAFGNDTLLLNVYSPPTAPFFYDLLQVCLPSPNYPLIIKSVKDRQGCDPFKNHTRVKTFTSSEIQVNPKLFPVDFLTHQYLAGHSELASNITITSIATASQSIIQSNEKLMICFLSDYNLYQDFQTADQRDLTKCQDITRYTFPVSNGTVYSFTHTFRQTSYYYIIILATTELEVQFSYALKYQFYDIRDYQTNNSCQISSETDWKNCTVSLDGSSSCFFAKVNQEGLHSPNSMTRIIGTFHRKKYTVVSTGLLAGLGAIFVSLLVSIAVVTTIYAYQMKKLCFSCRRCKN